MTSAKPDIVHLRSRSILFFLTLAAALISALAFSSLTAPAAAKRTARRSAAAQVNPNAEVVLTTRDLSERMTRMADLQPTTVAPRGVRLLHVEDTVRYQRFAGVGAAMTDTSAWLIHTRLSPAVSAQLMSNLFSASGIHISVVRVPIGASDFTATGTPYSYDDLPAGQSDLTLAHFSVAHDDAYIIPTLRQMVRLNPQVSVFANPWSPPPWMKANDAFDNLHHRGTLLPGMEPVLAAYFVKFIQAYEQAGIPVSAISAQNEPQAGSPYPGLELPPAQEGDFIANDLVPQLTAAGLHPAVWGMDRGALLPWAQTLLDTPAAPLLAGIAWHCYGGQTAMAELHRDDPRVAQMVSECSPGIIPYTAAEFVISAMRNWGSAAMMWNIALDPSGGPVQPKNYGCTGCTGLVTVNEVTHRVAYRLNFFQLGQVSRYVQLGAVRISSERWVKDFLHLPQGRYGVSAGLDNVAFLNPDGSKVLIAYNNSDHSQAFAFVSRGRYFSYRLAPRATVTFIWDRRS